MAWEKAKNPKAPSLQIDDSTVRKILNMYNLFQMVAKKKNIFLLKRTWKYVSDWAPRVKMWVCYAATEPELLFVIESTMNSSV